MAKQQQLIALILVLLSPAWAGLIDYASNEHAVAHTHQNVVRNFDGTVSHYAKSVATPYSQVHKQDTRISNNVYQPAYAAPAPAPAAVYTQHQPAAVYTQHQPAAVYAQPAPVYHQPQQHIPLTHATYASHQPAVAVHYSPAETVSHMSFDGFGTHWGF